MLGARQVRRRGCNAVPALLLAAVCLQILGSHVATASGHGDGYSYGAGAVAGTSKAPGWRKLLYDAVDDPINFKPMKTWKCEPKLSNVTAEGSSPPFFSDESDCTER
jgi:hypothetical protein